MPFKIEERRVGPVMVVQLSGRLTMGEATENLGAKLQELVEQGERALLLDLSGVPVIDSRGLKSLVQGYISLQKRGGRLKLLKLAPRVHEVLDYSHLLTVFEAFDDEQTALASF